jgi:enamine deaminase RidA (YjgF/YER057c/UK114 family)
MIERMKTGPRMSQIVKHGDVVYLAGQVGAGEGVSEQTADCLAKVDRLLAEAGSSRTHILQVIVWLKDMIDYDAMNEVWDAWIPTGHAPTRACGEARLAGPQYLIEVIVVAALHSDAPAA